MKTANDGKSNATKSNNTTGNSKQNDTKATDKNGQLRSSANDTTKLDNNSLTLNNQYLNDTKSIDLVNESLAFQHHDFNQDKLLFDDGQKLLFNNVLPDTIDSLATSNVHSNLSSSAKVNLATNLQSGSMSTGLSTHLNPNNLNLNTVLEPVLDDGDHNLTNQLLSFDLPTLAATSSSSNLTGPKSTKQLDYESRSNQSLLQPMSLSQNI